MSGRQQFYAALDILKTYYQKSKDNNKMIYGYARISAKTQLKGNSLEEQRNELKKNGCEVIIEEQFTGKTTLRPKFDELVHKTLESGDTLVVCKLDRFARNVTEGISVIRELFDKGVKVHVLNVGLLENTAMGNFFITTLLAVAELERCMILERTNAGREVARLKPGYREGRPRLPKAKVKLAMNLLEGHQHSFKEVSEMTGISIASLARYRRALRKGE